MSIDSFSTKRGEARFTDESIEFSESTSGYYKSLYSEYGKSNKLRLRLLFVGSMLSFPVVFGLILWLVSQSNGYAILSLTVLLLVGSLVVQYLEGYRSPDQIQLDNIVSVSTTRGTKLFIRPHIVIKYINGDSTYKRRVNLPSLVTPGGQEEYERVQKALRQRHLR